jgi:hypothetical protein
MLHHDPQCHPQGVSGAWLPGSNRHQLHNVLASQLGGAFVTVVFADSVDSPPIGLLRGRLKRAEFRRGKITDCERQHASWTRSTQSDRQRLIGQCRFIGRHKLGRPRQARQGHPLEAGAAEVPPRLAVPIHEAVHKFGRPAH